MKDIVYTEEIVEEIYLCSQDICYFAKVIGCELSYEGEVLLKAIADNQKINLINPNREFVIPYILYYMVFHDCQRIGIVTKKYREMMEAIQDTYEKLPLWMQRGIFQCSRKDFRLENGNHLVMTDIEHIPCGFKGKTLSALIIDYVEDYDEDEWIDFYNNSIPYLNGTLLLAAYKPNPISEYFKQGIFTIENIS